MTARPRLALTLGDPRGIGPEIAAAALADDALRARCELVVVGPRLAAGGPPLPAADVVVGDWDGGRDPASAGRLAGRAVEEAVRLALEGAVDGIVTAPLDKAALHAGGYDDPGHTELLARLTGADVAMMLASEAAGPPGSGRTGDDAAARSLRVVLATTHLPLREVPDAVTAEAIARAARVTRTGLERWFGIGQPRIALCALNPHAGDGGRFGREDQDVLAPAARANGLVGPLPADTVFVRALRGAFDAVIAPYHDVGMTAIKVAAFGRAVNVTLGLPFPRTSPDHGTALDIAGRGVADPSSLKLAVRTCAEIASRLAGGHLADGHLAGGAGA